MCIRDRDIDEWGIIHPLYFNLELDLIGGFGTPIRTSLIFVSKSSPNCNSNVAPFVYEMNSYVHRSKTGTIPFTSKKSSINSLGGILIFKYAFNFRILFPSL